MNDRGKLDFSALVNAENDEELKAMRAQWETFLESESEERERYLRSLEIDFSLNLMADEDRETPAKDAIARVLSEKKLEEQSESLSSLIKRFGEFLDKQQC